jgi:hypothetical protein
LKAQGEDEMTACFNYAFYEFADVASVRAIQGSAALKLLASEFDRVWGDRVKRSRDIVEVIQSIGA